MNSSEIKVDKEDVTEVKTETFSYNWKINNFSYLFKQPGESVKSPVFTLGSKNKIDCQLELYPNGSKKEYENYLSLYLNWQQSSITKGYCKMLLINNQKQIISSLIVELTKKPVYLRGIGSPRLIESYKVINTAFDLFNNDYITIHCEIVLSSDNLSSVIEGKKRKLEVSSGPSWLKKLFLEERLSDLKLIAVSCGQSLPAHRSVLAACSPVFEAMFTHDMLEQKLGEVKIDDCEYEVIKEMLRFIYLGKVDDLKSIIFELVKIANKYQITELIEFCETALIDEISVDNILKITTLADSYNMEQLKTLALDFGSLHLKEVLNSNDYKSSEYPQAMQSILETFAHQ